MKFAAWLSPSTHLQSYRRMRDAGKADRLGGDACAVTRQVASQFGSLTVIHPGQPRNGGAGRGWRTAPKKGSPVSSSSRRTYVIDTSVLLSDPHALRRFAEHDVVLPVVVITELEAKRHHNELGYFARNGTTAPRRPADHSRPSRRAVPVNNVGGTIHVELNHTDPGGAAGRLPTRRQRFAHPGCGAQSRRRRPCCHAGLQGSADAGQGLGALVFGRGVSRRAGRRDGVDRHERDRCQWRRS